jgi:predicted RNA-binding Zn ribbon-like protein
MVVAEAGGTWGRLKACRNEACRWIFYDASKNRSGRWCDMQLCGARHKMRAYRGRKSP